MTVARPGASIGARWLALLCTLLLLLAALLAVTLFLGDSWLSHLFENGKIDGWLMGGLWLTAGVGLVSVIYACVSLLRGSEPIGWMLWLIATTLLAALCYFAMIAYIALHSMG